MAQDERIDDVVNPVAQKQVDDLEKGLLRADAALKQFVATGKGIELKLGDSATIIQLNTLLKELNENTSEFIKSANDRKKATDNIKSATENLNKATENANKLSKEDLAFQKELDAAAKQHEKNILSIYAARDKEQKQLNELTNDYALFSKATAEAQLRAKNFAFQLGAAHPIAVQAASDANAMSDRLKSLDATVGQYQRNVGNYNMVGAQFNQLLRELPNLAQSPQIFIMALSNNISYFAESVKAARAEGQSWGQVLGTIRSSVFGLVGIANIAILAVSYFTNAMAKNSSEAKNDSKEIDGLSNSISNYIRKEQELRNLRGDKAGVGAGAEERKLELLKAQGAAQSEILAQEKKVQDAKILGINNEISAYEALTETIKGRYEVYGNQFTDEFARKQLAKDKDVIASLKSVTGVNQAEAEKQAKVIAESINTDKSIMKDFNTEILKLKQKRAAEENKVDIDSAEYQKKLREDALKEAEKSNKAYIAIKREELKDISEADAESNKQIIEEDKRAHESILKNEQSTLDQRTEARWAYANDIIALAGLEQTKEDEIEEQKNADNIRRINEEIKNDKKKNELLNLENERHLKQLLANYETFLTRKNDAISDYADKELKDQQDTQKKEYDATMKHLIEINELSKKNADIRNREQKERLRSELELAQKIGEIFTQLGSVYHNSIQRRIDDLQSQSQANDEAGQREIDHITALAQARVITAEEAQARIQDSEAKTASKRADIAAKEREDKRKQAIADKATALLQATIKTAVAVVDELTKGDPYTKIARAIAVGALGAAEIATIASTPLPQYKGGTEHHKGGFFVAGDGGEQELIIRPDGKSYMSADTPTVYNEAAGTKVYNQEQINNLLYGGLTPQLINVLAAKKQGNDGLSKSFESALDRQTNKLLWGMKQNQPISNVSVFGTDYYYLKNVKGK